MSMRKYLSNFKDLKLILKKSSLTLGMQHLIHERKYSLDDEEGSCFERLMDLLP